MSDLHHDFVSEIIPDLDQCVLDLAHWPIVLERITRVAGSHNAILIRVDGIARAGIMTPSATAVAEQYFAEGWDKIDHRLAGVPLMQSRGLAVDQDFTTREQFETLPFYQDYLARHGLRWFAGLGFKSDRTFWCLSIQRTLRQGLFDPFEQARLLELAPPLRRMVFLASAVEKARIAGMTDAFDVLSCAAAILDDHGKAIRWNASFENLLDDDLRVVTGRLVTADASANACLEALSRASTRHTVAAFAVRRRARPPIVIHVLPLSGETRRTFACGATLLVARTPEVGPVPAASLLQTAYGLTKAEARLAIALAEGESLADASQRFAVTLATIRTQVRSVFAKTGLSRQVDLVRLVVGLSLSR